MRSGELRSLPSTEDDCAFLSPVKKSRPAFKFGSCRARRDLPEEDIAEILLRLPARSIARLRCVSNSWLSITTDPSFILAHARRAPKSLLIRSISTIDRRYGHFYNQLFSFSVSGLSCSQVILEQISDEARSSSNGLVLFLRRENLRPSFEYYVMNPLTGLIVDIPGPNESNIKGSILELYYHRWTGEYRLLNIRIDILSGYSRRLDAEVLGLVGSFSSWRQIKAKVPSVSIPYEQSRILVNNCLYWTCQKFSEAHTILVFDILRETFSLLEPPFYGQKALPSSADSSCSEFGLVDMEGNLCFWVIYKDKSRMEKVTIHVWAAVDGDEKWKNTYSLCFNNEWHWAYYYPSTTQYTLVYCLCVKESELLFLFVGRHNLEKNNRMAEQVVQYLFHWDLKSGKYWAELLPTELHVMMSSGIIHKETLVTAPFHRTTALTRALP